MYKKSKAFTLIELLVVIAIIALLVSIMMPALSKVNKLARSVVCQAQLRQWCIVFTMYTEANNDKFPAALGLTPEYLREYYKEEELLLCPSAKKPYTEGARNPFGAHFYYDGLASYGHNSWITSEPAASGTDVDEGTWLWKQTTIQRAGEVPLVFDCAGWQNACPHHYDLPPEYDGHMEYDTNAHEMRYVCLNRHMQSVNMAFVDMSVRRVWLKELWNLRWHRQWWDKENEPEPDWNYGNGWMSSMREP